MAFSINTSALLSLFLVIFTNLQSLTLSSPQVPCLFIFGDSLVDNGNNNQLNTKAKANYPPYGIDFPQGPTGRFTNGRNLADFIAEFLGFQSYIPPFATAQGTQIMTGVNYASGSSGIRNETGRHFGDRISIDRQLKNHRVTVSRITKILGSTSAKQLLNQCLYYFVVGNNDYMNNYYIPEHYSSSKTYTKEQFATVLVNQYSRQLKRLYKLGAKKFAVSALSKLGCVPIMVGRGGNESTSCYKEANDAVKYFNDKLKVRVDSLNKKLKDAKIVYVNAMSLVPNGVRDMTQPCCKVMNNYGGCVPGQAPCLIRQLHAFYDKFHPTEVVVELVATASYLDILKLIV